MSCTTVDDGNCSVSTGTLSKKTTAIIYTVQNIIGTSLVFDDDKDSLTVDKP